jgi:hypothetical protein
MLQRGHVEAFGSGNPVHAEQRLMGLRGPLARGSVVARELLTTGQQSTQGPRLRLEASHPYPVEAETPEVLTNGFKPDTRGPGDRLRRPDPRRIEQTQQRIDGDRLGIAAEAVQARDYLPRVFRRLPQQQAARLRPP